jgi:hypothetical protein
VILRIQQVFKSGVHLEPHVIVTVIFVRDVDHDPLGMLAGVEHAEAVGIVDAGLRRAGSAAARKRRWRSL